MILFLLILLYTLPSCLSFSFTLPPPPLPLPLTPTELSTSTNLIQLHPSLTHNSHLITSKLLILSQQILSWNTKINLISRQPPPTLASIITQHVNPSLAAYALFKDYSGIDIADVGTGGGFPGLPLSIVLNEVASKTTVTLIDSTKKKLTVLEDVTSKYLKISNVRFMHSRVDPNDTSTSTFYDKRYDIILGRGVCSLPKFCQTVKHLLKQPNECTAKVKTDGGPFVLYITGAPIEREWGVEALDYVDIAGTEGKRVLKFGVGEVNLLSNVYAKILGGRDDVV